MVFKCIKVSYAINEYIKCQYISVGQNYTEPNRVPGSLLIFAGIWISFSQHTDLDALWRWPSFNCLPFSVIRVFFATSIRSIVTTYHFLFQNNWILFRIVIFVSQRLNTFRWVASHLCCQSHFYLMRLVTDLL